MKEYKNVKSYKVLNVSLILFSFVYCFLFYKQWLLMVPLFIVGTRGNLKTLTINTSIIYLFCLFTNWLNIILLSLCFCFYLLVNRLIQIFIESDKYNYLITTAFVATLLFRLQSDNIWICLSYAIFCISIVLVCDWIYESYDDYFTIRDNFWLEVVSIQLSADKNISGDYFDTFEWDNHQYLLLSDGMGQGKKAFDISKNIVTKIKQLLKRGYSIEKAIEFSNELVMTSEDAYASLDLIDCNHNILNIYKKGAENSYLIRENKITKISQYNLPMGIKDDSFESIKHVVYPNDILLLCSDGVTLSYPSFEEELANKEGEKELIEWVERISIKSKKELRDDFSIILVKFNEKN